MTDCRFTVNFRGMPPDMVKVGDELLLSGMATVRAITADLIDVSSYDRTRYLPGEIEIDLYSNNVAVVEVGP